MCTPAERIKAWITPRPDVTPEEIRARLAAGMDMRAGSRLLAARRPPQADQQQP